MTTGLAVVRGVGERDRKEKRKTLFGVGEQPSALPMLCLGAHGLVGRESSRRGGKMGC